MTLPVLSRRLEPPKGSGLRWWSDRARHVREKEGVPMLTRSRLVLALTAVMVVVWSSVASGTNGDAITAGQNTTATPPNPLTPTPNARTGGYVKGCGTSPPTGTPGEGKDSGCRGG